MTHPFDNLSEQIINISKAGAFDVVSQHRDELLAENAELKIKLAGAEARIKALHEFINDVRPKDAIVIEMQPCDDIPADLFQKPGNEDLENTLN